MNAPRFLVGRLRSARETAASSNRDTFLDVESSGDEVVAVPRAVARARILPALRAALGDRDPEVRASAVLALAKASLPGDADSARTIRAALADGDAEVRRWAILAHGILGDRSALPDLLALAGDLPAGRSLTGRPASEVPPPHRAAAGVAAGLVLRRLGQESDGNAVAALAGLAAREDPRRDVRLGAILGLGLAGGSGAGSVLLDILRNRGADEIVRAQAATALGRMGVRGALSDVLAGLDDPSGFVAAACAQAAGLLAPRDHVEAARRLVETTAAAPDEATRRLSLLALGECGSPEGRAALLDVLRRGQSGERACAAVALGLAAWKIPADGEGLETVFRAALPLAKGPDERAALAVALALAGARGARPEIESELARQRTGDQAGRIALAAGILGAETSRAVLEPLALRPGPEGVRRGAAIALGMSGDPGIVGTLAAVLSAGHPTRAVAGAAAAALGWLGDRDAVDPLVAVLSGTSAGRSSDSVRAYAAAALGRLGDKDSPPAPELLRINGFWLAATPAILDLMCVF